jgi:hypothetical protein
MQFYVSLSHGYTQECREAYDKWKKMEEKVKHLSQEAKQKIVLDVGGTRFTTTPTTLSKSEMLSAIASGRWAPEEDGCYFINESGSKFVYVMQYLRTGRWFVEHLSNSYKEALNSLANYLGVPKPYHKHAPPRTPTPKPFIPALCAGLPWYWLNGKSIVRDALYIAKRDGWSSTDFHRCVDNKGPTLVVCRAANGVVFGGYTSTSWERSNVRS